MGRGCVCVCPAVGGLPSTVVVRVCHPQQRALGGVCRDQFKFKFKSADGLYRVGRYACTSVLLTLDASFDAEAMSEHVK
jgi:hypothetical protein